MKVTVEVSAGEVISLLAYHNDKERGLSQTEQDYEELTYEEIADNWMSGSDLSF